jgi:hypothetical protein
MVNIPEQDDPTLLAMKQAAKVDGNKQKKRNYLGASLIGNPCSRQIWYQYMGYQQEPFEAETLWNFEDGHRIEDITAMRLRRVHGITLYTHDDSGNQYGFSDFDGKFKGHCDGVIVGLLQAPKTAHVWENKCSAEKKFNEFVSVKAKFGEKLTLKNWNENYYAQAQLYMHYLKLDRHYTTVAKAGGRDYASCRTEYDPEYAEQIRDKAFKIINSKEPPPKINENPDFYICKFCSFREICHDKKDTSPIPAFSNTVPF